MLNAPNIGDRIHLIFDDAPDQPLDVTVCAVLSNQQEGLGPEIADYVAGWLEVSSSSCGTAGDRISISFGTDFRYDLGGRKPNISPAII